MVSYGPHKPKFSVQVGVPHPFNEPNTTEGYLHKLPLNCEPCSLSLSQMTSLKVKK